MATSRRNTRKKGITLYNKILKEFTKVNKQLPLERQLSIKERRKYIKDVIYPQYKGNAPSRVAARAIKVSIFQVIDRIAPKEECDVNYISPSVYADISWHDLDNYIRDVLPKCIFIRIDAGQFGSTKIFNTLNYNYTRNGVKKIVDNIREYVNNNSATDVSLTGVKKLKRGKANDGTAENYYLDFILVVNGNPQDDITPVVYNVPTNERRVVRSVKSAILERLRQLELKKKRGKNARKSARKKLQQINEINKKQRKAKRQSTKDRLADDKLIIYQKMNKQLDAALRKGSITQEQYDRYITELLKKTLDNRRGGGQV